MMKLTDHTMRISLRREDFRVAIGRPFGLVAAGALILSETLFIVRGDSSPHVLLLVIPLAVLILCALLLALMSLRYHLDVGPHGIDCYELWMRPRHMNWDAVTRTRLLCVLGLEYLLIGVSNRWWPIWIPLFVQREKLLRDLLINYVDDAHPLKHQLDEPA